MIKQYGLTKTLSFAQMPEGFKKCKDFAKDTKDGKECKDDLCPVVFANNHALPSELFG
jgi:hypothetical protein